MKIPSWIRGNLHEIYVVFIQGRCQLTWIFFEMNKFLWIWRNLYEFYIMLMYWKCQLTWKDIHFMCKMRKTCFYLIFPSFIPLVFFYPNKCSYGRDLKTKQGRWGGLCSQTLLLSVQLGCFGSDAKIKRFSKVCRNGRQLYLVITRCSNFHVCCLNLLNNSRKSWKVKEILQS